MTLHTPVYVQPVNGDPSFPNGIPFSAQELRRNIQAMLSVASPGTQSGVTPLDQQFAVAQHAAGANFSVDVAAGHAFVPGTDIANQSVYGCWNDGVVNVTVPSAPASGTENHRLVLQIEDKYSNAVWTGYTANLSLLADTGSGTPAQPASAITLALISVTAGQASVLNANITDKRPMLGATVLTDVTHFPVTGTSDAPLSIAYPIPANSANAATTYRGKVRGNGVMWSGTSEDIVLTAYVSGSITATSQLHTSQIMGTGVAFSWEAEVEVVVQTTGASGTCDVHIEGTVSIFGGTIATGNTGVADTLPFVIQATGEAFNTTVPNTVQLEGHWTLISGSGGTLNGRSSSWERLGV